MINPKKKVTPIRMQYQKCLDMGLAAISPNHNREAHNKRIKKARREFSNFLEKGIPIDEALRKSLRIAAGGENTRYQIGISVALSHIPPKRSLIACLYQKVTESITNLYQRSINRVFGKYSLESRSGYKFPSKI